jgi:hypothetical protein
MARAWLAAAGVLGRLVGVAGRGLPGLAGAGLVCYGLWLAWAPLGFIAAGGFLLLLDRRVA